MFKNSCILILLTALVSLVNAGMIELGGKEIGHIVSVPVIEGAGIYTSAKMIGTGDANATAAGITNISLLAINATIGVIKVFGNVDNYQAWKTAHRIVGYTIAGASVWMAVSAITNNNTSKLDKGIAGGYSALTFVPIILFSF